MNKISGSDPEAAMSPSVRHVALLTEYDGTGFNGWQTQASGRTVQQVLMQAIAELTGEKNVHLHGCSRTDTGVHALGHVSHFSTGSRIPALKLPLALNSHLPLDVAVRSACDVAPDFHAQYSTRAKIYSYRFWHGTCRPAYDRLQASHVAGPLDLDRMRLAIPYLLGRHDFRAFMDQGSSGRNPVRTLQAMTLTSQGPLIILKVQGDGFLYHMVRILAGTLLLVGQGKLLPEDMPDLLTNGDRKLSGKTMPPQGLCLEQVIYNPPLFADYFGAVAEEGEENEQFALE